MSVCCLKAMRSGDGPGGLSLLFNVELVKKVTALVADSWMALLSLPNFAMDLLACTSLNVTHRIVIRKENLLPGEASTSI